MVIQVKRKTFSLDILNDNLSSKFSLFSITNRYLKRHRLQKELFFLFFDIIAANILKFYLPNDLIFIPENKIILQVVSYCTNVHQTHSII
jgi:hypothetical protein